MLSPQALSEDDRRLVAAWAADCASRVLPLFEREAPQDGRARDAIERARAFSRGELDTADEIRRRFVAGRAASAVTSSAAVAAARSAAQAAGVAHMGAHALGAAGYAVKAATLDEPGCERREIDWQIDRMSPGVRGALARIPRVGTDSSGPLGPGSLLTRGVVGDAIGALQDALNTDGWLRTATFQHDGQRTPLAAPRALHSTVARSPERERTHPEVGAE